MFKPQFIIEEKRHEHWLMERFHFHEHCELYFPLCSQGTLFLGNESYSLAEQNLYFISANSLHRSTAPNDHWRFVLHLSFESIEKFSTPQSDFSKLAHCPFRTATLSDKEKQETQALFTALLQQENDGNFGKDILQSMHLMSLLLYVTPLLLESQIPLPSQTRDSLRIAPILDYIRENLSEPLSLDKIAGIFYLNKHHLCRIFKSATGFTVMEYIIHCRILKAQQFLQEGYSVQRAGELSGFSDNSHFIRTFGKIVGVSPGKYTRSYQNSDKITLPSSPYETL